MKTKELEQTSAYLNELSQNYKKKAGRTSESYDKDYRDKMTPFYEGKAQAFLQASKILDAVTKKRWKQVAS